MPELTWIGKDRVVNHHHEVPFRILEKQYTFGKEGSGNKIMTEDQLKALDAIRRTMQKHVADLKSLRSITEVTKR